MSKKSRRNKEMIKLLKWIHKYGGCWELVCTPNHEYMDRERMRSLIQQLHKMKRDDMIFVLLSVHRNADFLVTLWDHAALPLIKSAWRNGDQEKVITQLTNFLA